MIHRVVGTAVMLLWVWILFHLHRWAPGLEAAASANLPPRQRGGAFYVLLLPLLGAALLIFPDLFMERFDTFSKLTNEPLLGVGVWRFFGYFALLVSWGLFRLFQ